MVTQVWPLISNATAAANSAEVVARGPMQGGFIVNPLYAADQGLAFAEPLYVDMVTEAGGVANTTTSAIYPGGSFFFIPGFAGQISVRAASANHRFSGVVYHDPTNYEPSTNAWPPRGPTTLTAVIPSYLYKQYDDDEDMQAFVDSFNALAQLYVTWFATILLPVYSQGNVSGTLLDWVAAGLYGFLRPALPTGQKQRVGPYNTWMFNTNMYNGGRLILPDELYETTDDIFRRILTWHLYKGDGKIFNIRWLKRRVMRFLTGTDGTGGETDQTYQVSVTFGANYEVNINLRGVRVVGFGGALYNGGMFNTFAYNSSSLTIIHYAISPLVPVFKSAVEAGVLELPFQYTFIVNV